MIDTHDPARPTGRRSAGTSPVAWTLVIAVAVALLCLRIPSFVEVAAAAVGQQAASLDDPALAGAAVTVGAVSAAAIHVLLLGLGALLATLLERALGPRAISARVLGGRLRLGVGGLTFAAIVLSLQVAAVGLGVAAVERSWPVWLAAAAVALLAPAAFPAARSSGRTYARALLASCGTAVLLCAG